MKYLNYRASKKKQKRFDPEQRLLHPMETKRRIYLFLMQKEKIYSSKCLLPRQGTSPMFLQQRPVLFCLIEMWCKQSRTDITFPPFSPLLFSYLVIKSISFLGESLICGQLIAQCFCMYLGKLQGYSTSNNVTWLNPLKQLTPL